MESQESLRNFAVYSKTSFFVCFIFLLHHKEFIYFNIQQCFKGDGSEGAFDLLCVFKLKAIQIN